MPSADEHVSVELTRPAAAEPGGPDSPDRWPRSLRVIVGFAIGCVVAGGLIAAGSAHHPTRAMSWTSAYLVLVAGVVGVGLPLSLRVVDASTKGVQRITVTSLCWQFGNTEVVTGTLLHKPALVTGGGMFLLAALAYAAALLHKGKREHRRLVRFCYVIALVLALSIPAGVVLSVTRAGS
ncbi:hypothetical protein Acel_0492 [Acidothermus cellulolyticus 11B]|uniref:Uncharacterized protein n=1 Tax=Acidothermus cellulolyticus (strain ATCC 43068 / DSM 8971 / 11B) TaxID=351607 RepID=A0LS55_ACIC1|nr:hypothetical protein Acel_0492 [Acidothermus cellulolyticus 11B]